MAKVVSRDVGMADATGGRAKSLELAEFRGGKTRTGPTRLAKLLTVVRFSRDSERPAFHISRQFPADAGKVALNLGRACQCGANVRQHILGSHDVQEIGS